MALDQTVRRPDRRTLIGGCPRHMVRLSPAGCSALDELLDGGAHSAAARLLGRRLLDDGIAHPCVRPAESAGLVTVVIPVRDRPGQLARCLAALQPDVAVTIVDDGSHERERIAAIAASRDACLIRHDRPQGPAAARNAGLRSLATELVAFLDSDCVPTRGWLRLLTGHFEDPAVGAVAPRVRPLVDGPGTAVGRYLRSRCPLDMGGQPAVVAPGGRVAYLPSAALVVRSAALEDGFDERLRYGEDVDLVWRMSDAGWTIRYEPSAVVEHDEPGSMRTLASRRFHYGTSAAKLLERHPGKLHAAHLQAATTASAGILLAGRPRAAVALLLADGVRSVVRARRRGIGAALAGRWFADASANTLLALGRPAATFGLPVAAAISLRRQSRGIFGLVALPALLEWRDRNTGLDPLRWLMLATLDDISYALGVWQGCIQARDGRALLPAGVGRSRPPS